VNDFENNLREMHHNPGHVSVIVEAAKKKRMRFDITSFKYGEIAYAKDNIVILRRGTGQFMDGLFERQPSCVSGQQSALLLLRCHISLIAPRGNQAFNLLCREFSDGHNRAKETERLTSATGTWKWALQTRLVQELTSEQSRNKTQVPVRSMELLGDVRGIRQCSFIVQRRKTTSPRYNPA